MFQWNEAFFWILYKTTVTQSLTVRFSSARPLCWSLFQPYFPRKFSFFYWYFLLGLVSVYFVVSKWYKAGLARQRICFLLL